MSRVASNLNLNLPWAIQIPKDYSFNTQFFSNTCVFLDQMDFKTIKYCIGTIEHLFLNANYQKKITGLSPRKNRGLFCAYDFHLSDTGPKLIEINTNAGGCLLNFHLLKAQTTTPPYSELPFDVLNVPHLILEHFKKEWLLFNNDSQNISQIAIIDDQPKEQFLYPEFELFQDLLSKYLAPTHIIDAKDLKYENQEFFVQNSNQQKIKFDFIYNRLTDFYFSLDIHQSIKKAYDENICLITPNPFNHAIYAHKKNLQLLRDQNFLSSLGIEQTSIELLQKIILKSEEVTSDNKEQLWQNRKNLFFKPNLGYGSKAVYRGDKITHKVFEEIIQGNYLAQEYVPAPHRLVIDNKMEKQFLKFDLRIYVYAGSPFMATARLYQGQATNFRTPYGGFAPVYIVKE